MLLSFIFRNKPLFLWAAIAVAATLVSFYIYILRGKIETLTAELALSKTQTAVVESSNRELRAAIDRQNITIEEFKAKYDEKTALYNAEIAKAKQNTAKANKRADEIMNSTPPAGASLCEAADALFNQEIVSK